MKRVPSGQWVEVGRLIPAFTGPALVRLRAKFAANSGGIRQLALVQNEEGGEQKALAQAVAIANTLGNPTPLAIERPASLGPGLLSLQVFQDSGSVLDVEGSLSMLPSVPKQLNVPEGMRDVAQHFFGLSGVGMTLSASPSLREQTEQRILQRNTEQLQQAREALVAQQERLLKVTDEPPSLAERALAKISETFRVAAQADLKKQLIEVEYTALGPDDSIRRTQRLASGEIVEIVGSPGINFDIPQRENPYPRYYYNDDLDALPPVPPGYVPPDDLDEDDLDETDPRYLPRKPAPAVQADAIVPDAEIARRRRFARHDEAISMASRSSYRWNDPLGRYIDAQGRIVSARRVRAELDRAIVGANLRAKELALQLQAGKIDVRTWRTEMRVLVRNVHLYSAAAARGGWAQMNLAAYGQVGGVLRRQYKYLDRFARQLSLGLPRDGFFLNRAELYTEAARGTFELARRDEMVKRGFDEEKNVLDDGARHCEGTMSCPAQRAKGWVAVGTLVPIGRRVCGTRCRCRIIYRRSKEVAA